MASKAKEQQLEQRRAHVANLRTSVPEELRKLRNWVLWKYQVRNGSKTKPPKMPNGSPAKSTDPSTWCYFENAAEAYIKGRFDGIGFVFTDSSYMGIDIDHCIDADGNVSELAKDIVRTIEHGYAEISPSGAGLHIIVKATKPAGECKTYIEDGQALEMYDTSRYFTMTGRIYEDELGYQYGSVNDDAADVQDAIYTVFGKYWRAGQTTSTDGTKRAKGSVLSVDAVTGGLSDEAIIARITNCRAGKKSKEGDSERVLNLWLGRWEEAGYKSQSEADLALMNALAFWTAKNPDQMERLFNSSGLFRSKKWSQTTDSSRGLTYGAQMIAKACESTTSVFSLQRKRSIYFPKVDEDGIPISCHIDNIKAMLDYLGIVLRFNDVSHKVDVYNGGNKDDFNYESVLAEVKSYCHEHGLKINKEDLYSGCRYWADREHYNPLLDYFKSCYERYKTDTHCEESFKLLCQALPVTAVDPDFCYHLLHLWLRQVVYLSDNSGSTKPQSILVLRGAQGIGKSSLIARMLPRELVLPEQGLDMSNKDNIISCTSVGICELSELGGTLKEASSYKRFISAEIDKYRAPYDRIDHTYPRRTSFVGTVNDSTFLIDKTGDRRYFVLPLRRIEWDVLAKVDFPKLWAYIYSEYLDGATYRLTSEETQRIKVVNRRYSKLTDVEQQIVDLLCWSERKELWRLVTPTELCEELTGNVSRANVFGRRLLEMVDRGEIDPPVEQHGTGVKKYRLPCKIMTNSAD